MNFLPIIGAPAISATTNSCMYNGTDIMSILSIAKAAVRILQIIVPIALIVWGTIDLAQAVISGDEKKMKEKRKPFIQRVISAVIVFLVPWIVEFVLSFVSNGEWVNCWKAASGNLSTDSGISTKIRDKNKNIFENK